MGTSNQLFQNLKSNGKISDKLLKYFTYGYKKVSNLGNFIFYLRFTRDCIVFLISNCGTSTEKDFEFLDYHLKPIMQKGKSYIKDSGDFINKIKSLQNIPEGAILVTADVVGLYPSIPHEAGLKALREALDNRENKQIPTENLLKMAEFVLKNNYFEFNGKVKKQLSCTATGTKFAPTYGSTFMDKLESYFLKSQELPPLLCYCYIDVVFFIWTHGEEKLASFIDDLNNYHPNIKFTRWSNKEHIPFLDLNVNLLGNKLSTNLTLNQLTGISICTILLHTQNILRNLLFTAKL